MRPRLYWCATPGGDRDFWVVANSGLDAAAFFAGENGYEVFDVAVEHILLISKVDDRRLYSNIADYPTKAHLADWGINYSQVFHVFELQGRIFRPEGIVRALMQAAAQVRQRLRKKARA